MRSRVSRVVVVTAAMLAVIFGTALGVGRGSPVAKPAAAVAAVQYDASGVSGAYAAKVLNSLARKDAGRSARAMTKVHFILNWLPNVEFAGLWMAQKFHWWSRAGISITYQPWSQSVVPETDVPHEGGNTFGFQAGAAIDIARSKGVNITALYTDTQRSVFGLTVLAKSHIYKITDLKGKRIGYQPHELYVPQTMLAYAGLKTTDWKPVPVTFDIVQLTQGAVDAYETFLTNEPIALKLQGINTRSFAASDYGYHTYDDVLFTYNGLIQKNPALVRKVVTNVAQGFQWAHSNPNQAARYTVQCCFSKPGSGETKSTHLRQQELESQAFVRFARDSRGRFSGLMSTANWRALNNTLFKYGLIHSKPNPATIYTNKFNPYR